MCVRFCDFSVIYITHGAKKFRSDGGGGISGNSNHSGDDQA